MHDAIIVKVESINPIPNADRIIEAKLSNGNTIISTVVTGVDTRVEDIGIYFDAGEIETLTQSLEPKGFLSALKRKIL